MSTPRTAKPLAGLRVLGISPAPTHQTVAGNRARVRALLDRLVSLGATVRFVHILHEEGDLPAMQAHWSPGGAAQLPFTYPPLQHASWNRFARQCRRYLRLPLPLYETADDWCDRANATPVRHEVETFRPHVILMTYFWNSLLLDGLPPDILRVLDAQDVFTDRNEKMRRTGIPMQWFSVPRDEEKRGLDRFDVILAIQEQEAAFYRSLTEHPVVTVGHLLPILNAGPPPSTGRLLIVGSDNPANVDGARWFLRDVWPGIRARRPDASLQIAGRLSKYLSPVAGVTLQGAVESLLPMYRDATLVVNPLRGGTGLKIKSAEALAAGRVVVTTPSAAEGLEDAIGCGLVVATTATEMVATIAALLGDRDRVLMLSQAAAAFAERWNERYAAAFDEVFIEARNAAAASPA